MLHVNFEVPLSFDNSSRYGFTGANSRFYVFRLLDKSIEVFLSFSVLNFAGLRVFFFFSNIFLASLKRKKSIELQNRSSSKSPPTITVNMVM